MHPAKRTLHPSKRTLSVITVVAAVILSFLASISLAVRQAGAVEGGGNESWQHSSLEVRGHSNLPDDFLLGLEASQAIASHFGLVESDSLVRRLNDIGYRLAYNSGRPDVLFTFQILDVDEPNAMALPGGWIFITRGILDIGLTDAEMANLIGHEISHVTHKDFSRQGRLDGLLSLLQTAVVVAVTMAGSAASQSAQGPVIEQPGSYGYGYPQTSAEAAAVGTEVFGSVFHELLLRGYSRKLEMEADEGGRRLAGLAGYPREAGALLLQKLHDRIYEDREFGYWNTHPYFTDRVGVARAAAAGSDYAPIPEEIAGYRLKIQEGLASAAQAMRDESIADYLYELAQRAGTNAGSNLAIHTKLLYFRLNRIAGRDPLLRSYGPLERDFDALISDARAAAFDPSRIRDLQVTRDSIEVEREALLPKYQKALGGGNASTMVIEHYLQNFSDQPDANRLLLELARGYRLSGRPDLAAERLVRILSDSTGKTGSSGGVDPDSAREEFKLTLPQITDPDIGEELYSRIPQQDLKAAVSDRMKALADTLSSLDRVGRFVQANPSSSFIELYRGRLATLANLEFKKGRLGEALGDQQSALTAYNRIVILAPGSSVAEGARQGIARIQAVAASGSDR